MSNESNEKQENQKENPKKQTAKTPNKPKFLKILFVDSEMGTRHLLVNLINKHLGKDEFMAIAVESAKEAIKLLWEDRNIKIVITELNLPDKISGLDLIKVTRQLGLPVHIFVLTGYPDPASLEEAMFYGVRGFFDKSKLDLFDLVEIFKRYKQEVIEFSPRFFEEPERITKKANGKEFGSYHYLRWRDFQGNLRAMSFGKNEENEEVN